MVSLFYVVTRTIFFTTTNILCGFSIFTIIRNKELRRCPIFCFIALAEAMDMIRIIAIFYVHDLPSAIVGHEAFEDTIGYVLFFILLRLVCHFLILAAMSIGFVIGVIRPSVFVKFARFRKHLVICMISISIILASLAFIKDHWDRKFSIERLAWPPKRNTLENDVLNTSLTGMKGTLLVVVSLSAIIIIICFCKVKRKANIVKVKKNQQKDGTQDHEILMVGGFFVLALFYFLPNVVLLTYQLFPDSIQTYEVIETISTTIEFLKWICYSLSSKRFRANMFSIITTVKFTFIDLLYRATFLSSDI